MSTTDGFGLIVQASVTGSLFPPVSVVVSPTNLTADASPSSYSSIVIGSPQNPVTYSVYSPSQGSTVNAFLATSVATQSSGGSRLLEPIVVVTGFDWDLGVASSAPVGSVMNGLSFKASYTAGDGSGPGIVTGTFSADGSSASIQEVGSNGTTYNLTATRQQ